MTSSGVPALIDYANKATKKLASLLGSQQPRPRDAPPDEYQAGGRSRRLTASRHAFMREVSLSVQYLVCVKVQD